MSTNVLRARRHSKMSYAKRIRTLVKRPFFWALTILGNSLIIVGSVLIHLSESGFQAQPFEFIDSVLWSTGIVTTIGYGSYIPLTLLGKMSVLGLMLFGTLFVWSYMAFIVAALISPEISSLEKDMNEVERELLILKQMEELKNTQPQGAK